MTSLVVQCLGLHASTAGVPGSVPGLGTKIPQTARAAKHKHKTTTKTSQTDCRGSWGRDQDKGDHISQEREAGVGDLFKVTEQVDGKAET